MQDRVDISKTDDGIDAEDKQKVHDLHNVHKRTTQTAEKKRKNDICYERTFGAAILLPVVFAIVRLSCGLQAPAANGATAAYLHPDQRS